MRTFHQPNGTDGVPALCFYRPAAAEGGREPSMWHGPPSAIICSPHANETRFWDMDMCLVQANMGHPTRSQLSHTHTHTLIFAEQADKALTDPVGPARLTTRKVERTDGEWEDGWMGILYRPLANRGEKHCHTPVLYSHITNLTSLWLGSAPDLAMRRCCQRDNLLADISAFPDRSPSDDDDLLSPLTEMKWATGRR